MFQKTKILSRPKAQARTHILSLLDFETVVWILGFSKSKSRKMGFPKTISFQTTSFQIHFVPFSTRLGSRRSTRCFDGYFQDPCAAPGKVHPREFPLFLGSQKCETLKHLFKMKRWKCKCSETVSKFDLLWHQILQLVRTLANEFSRELMKLVCRYKSRRIWIDGTNSTNRRNLNKRSNTERSIHTVHAIAPSWNSS